MNINTQEWDAYFFATICGAVLLLILLALSQPKYNKEDTLWQIEQAKEEKKRQEIQAKNKTALVGSKILYIGPVTNDTIYIRTDKGDITFEAKGRKSNYLIPNYNLDKKD